MIPMRSISKHSPSQRTSLAMDWLYQAAWRALKSLHRRTGRRSKPRLKTSKKNLRSCLGFLCWLLARFPPSARVYPYARVSPNSPTEVISFRWGFSLPQNARSALAPSLLIGCLSPIIFSCTASIHQEHAPSYPTNRTIVALIAAYCLEVIFFLSGIWYTA